jgi:adenylate kinase family enzyme
MALGSRIVIIGNSGSGKTTLARELARREDLPATDLDRVHWQDEVTVKRDEQIAAAMVAKLAAEPRWVIEGVYGWLAAVALPFASTLIWLDMPWNVCRDGLTERGPWKGAAPSDHAAFFDWAEAYWVRTTSTSFAGHRSLFDGFVGTKLRFESRAELADFLANATGFSRQVSSQPCADPH